MQRWVVRRLLLLSVLLVAVPVTAQSPRLIRVSVEFRQTTLQSRDAVQGGGVITTERGQPRARAGVGVESSERRVQRSSGMFTLVQDGGESLLTVATEVPYQQVVFYRDYASGSGQLATGVSFQEVGTSLKVRASLLAGNQVRVRLTPRISYFAADGSGTLEFTEAATELIVPSGRPVMVGGTTSDLHSVMREVLGLARERAAGESTIVLTATAQ
jgi:Bacterial type II and III secretion system protein